jgi:hypothetical protein
MVLAQTQTTSLKGALAGGALFTWAKAVAGQADPGKLFNPS